MDPARLTRLTAFSTLPPAELAAVAARAREESATAGTVLMREDDFACDLVGILDGAVEVSCGGSPVATLQAGEIVGELGCLSRGRRCATVVATEPVVLVRITHWDVRRLRQIAPAAVAAIVAVAEERERLIAA